MSPDPLAHDLDLVEQAREGSQEAIVELWMRHYPAALSAARRTSRQARDAEELASDAFSNMLGAFATGGGPTGSVRAYLLTSVRNLAVSRSRRSSASEVLSDDVAVFEYGSSSPVDPMSRQTEISMMRQAFAALPRRWQIILWRTAVDHDRNIEIGHDLDISPNAVAALAKRARRGLRQAYLQVHLSTKGLDPDCEPFVRRLPVLAVEGSVPSDDLARHLATCTTCPGRLAELQHVEQQLGSMLGPAVLLTAPGVLSPALAAGASSAAVVSASATGGSAASGAGAAAASASGASGTTAAASSLVTKLTVGKIVAATAVGAAAVSAGLLIPREHEPPSHPTTRVAPTSTPPEQSSPAAPPTTTTTPTVTSEPAGTREPIGSTTPAPPPSEPTGTPTTASTTTPMTPSPTPTAAKKPLMVGMGISGSPRRTAIAVGAQARGTTGDIRLTLTLPPGVTLRGASGDWTSCDQAGRVISCTARSATGHWAGTIVTHWAGGISGRITAEVEATYRNGGHVRASAAASWPA